MRRGPRMNRNRSDRYELASATDARMLMWPSRILLGARASARAKAGGLQVIAGEAVVHRADRGTRIKGRCNVAAVWGGCPLEKEPPGMGGRDAHLRGKISRRRNAPGLENLPHPPYSRLGCDQRPVRPVDERLGYARRRGGR